jgi:hypothetical protein
MFLLTYYVSIDNIDPAHTYQASGTIQLILDHAFNAMFGNRKPPTWGNYLDNARLACFDGCKCANPFRNSCKEVIQFRKPKGLNVPDGAG